MFWIPQESPYRVKPSGQLIYCLQKVSNSISTCSRVTITHMYLSPVVPDHHSETIIKLFKHPQNHRDTHTIISLQHYKCFDLINKRVELTVFVWWDHILLTCFSSYWCLIVNSGRGQWRVKPHTHTGETGPEVREEAFKVKLGQRQIQLNMNNIWLNSLLSRPKLCF